MAITYKNFTAYPIQILGLDESYNDGFIAIENFVKEEINYSGDVVDLDVILPYFVFFRFCEYRQSIVNANTGETKAVNEFTEPTQYAQIRAWNIGVNKLIDLCKLKSKTAHWIYTTEIGLL